MLLRVDGCARGWKAAQTGAVRTYVRACVRLRVEGCALVGGWLRLRRMAGRARRFRVEGARARRRHPRRRRRVVVVDDDVVGVVGVVVVDQL